MKALTQFKLIPHGCESSFYLVSNVKLAWLAKMKYLDAKRASYASNQRAWIARFFLKFTNENNNGEATT